jgi:hypothetical protein
MTPTNRVRVMVIMGVGRAPNFQGCSEWLGIAAPGESSIQLELDA